MYKRIILKLSGETLAPERFSESDASHSFEASRVDRAAKAIVALSDLGVQVGVVMGGGNIWRGRFSDEMNPVNADQMGMLATIINALCVQDALQRLGRKATVFTAQEMTRFAELYRADKAVSALERGEIVLLAGGSGNPFFTTDTAAALRGAEMGVDVVLKATKVDGVYSADPQKDPSATRYSSLSFDEAMSRNLGIMDATAFALCRDRKLPIKVFSIFKPGALKAVLLGADEGTLVHA